MDYPLDADGIPLATTEVEAVSLGVDIAIELMRSRGAVQRGYLAAEVGAVICTLLQRMYATLHSQVDAPAADYWLGNIFEATQKVLKDVRGIDVQFSFLRKD